MKIFRRTLMIATMVCGVLSATQVFAQEIVNPGFENGWQGWTDGDASGYDVANEFMYFKAGAYNQNNSGNPEDYAQVTFYELAASH